MTDEPRYQVSQGLEVLSPRSGQAYPIPCDEWILLREKIGALASEPWVFHTVGSLLLGAGLSAFVAVLLGSFALPTQERQRVVAWAVVAVGAITGGACMYFAYAQRAIQHERATDVVAQMRLIERRYETASS